MPPKSRANRASLSAFGSPTAQPQTISAQMRQACRQSPRVGPWLWRTGSGRSIMKFKRFDRLRRHYESPAGTAICSRPFIGLPRLKNSKTTTQNTRAESRGAFFARNKPRLAALSGRRAQQKIQRMRPLLALNGLITPIALISLAGLVLSACATNSRPGDETARTVMVNGQTHFVRQLTASTWTATPTDPARAVATRPIDAAALLLAIEKTSGCKVTDSHYSRNSTQLDAQVDCGDRLKN